MTTSTSAVMPLTSDEVQTIVDHASTAISACAMTRSQPLVDRNYSLIGSLRLHRKAFGLDLLRAPANVVLALPPRNLQRQASMPPVPTGWPIASGDRRSFSTQTSLTS